MLDRPMSTYGGVYGDLFIWQCEISDFLIYCIIKQSVLNEGLHYVDVLFAFAQRNHKAKLK